MNNIYRKVEGCWKTGTQMRKDRLSNLFYNCLYLLDTKNEYITFINFVKLMKCKKIINEIHNHFGAWDTTIPLMRRFRILDVNALGFIHHDGFVEKAQYAFSS